MKIQKSASMLLTLLTLCALVPGLDAQTAETVVFRARMLPSNENPPIDINASGNAIMRAHVVRNAAGEVISGTVDFNVIYTFPGDITFTGLHIHDGVAGINGPVMINTGLSGANTIRSETGQGIIDRPGHVLTTAAGALATLKSML
ncbi:MAG: CHRD domain-containing protein, partial [Bryobacteraceae bacterium]